jgi:hypothetical protein
VLGLEKAYGPQLLIVYVPEFFGTRHSSAEPFEQQVLRQSAPDWHIGIFGLAGAATCAFSFLIASQVLKCHPKARMRFTPPERRTPHGACVRDSWYDIQI